MQRTLVLSLALAGAALAACHTGYREGKSKIAENRTTEVTVGNEYLSERLQIRDLRKRRGADQCLTIEFELLNTWTNRLEFSYAIVWYDAGGMQLVEGERETMALEGHEDRTLRYTAPEPAATRWKLDVQRP